MTNVRFGKAPRERFRRRLPNDTATPTALSLELLRNTGWQCLVVEVNMRIPRQGDEEDLVFKKDLFGFLDIVALKGKHTRGVQTTSLSNTSARLKKIQCSPWFEWLRLAGWEVHVHGWGPKGVVVTDMMAKDAQGNDLYPTLWKQILLAQQAKKKFPAHTQSTLAI